MLDEDGWPHPDRRSSTPQLRMQSPQEGDTLNEDGWSLSDWVSSPPRSSMQSPHEPGEVRIQERDTLKDYGWGSSSPHKYGCTLSEWGSSPPRSRMQSPQEPGEVRFQNGDTLNDGQYTVITKLGRGAVASVWLATQNSDSSYVAIKIYYNNQHDPRHEVDILSSIDHSPYLVRFISTFEHRSSTDNHLCLVLEPMSYHIDRLIDNLYQFDSTYSRRNLDYPAWMARKIMLDVLNGLDTLHQAGIVHADLLPRNILVCTDLENSAEIALGYIKPRHGMRFAVKIADMGSAFRLHTTTLLTYMSKGLMPPEMLLNEPPNTNIDLWCYGILVWSLFTSTTLIWPPMFDEKADRLFLEMYCLFGSLPRWLMDGWAAQTEDHDNWLDKSNNLLPEKLAFVVPKLSLEERFKKEKSPTVSDEEALEICDFLRYCFTLDPATRPSAKQLLQHPYVVKIAESWASTIPVDSR